MEEPITKGHKECFRMMKMCILVMVVTLRLYKCMHLSKLTAVHFYKRMNFTVCNLYINTPDFLKAGQSNYANTIIAWNGAMLSTRFYTAFSNLLY